jgi:hypothetical protein
MGLFICHSEGAAVGAEFQGALNFSALHRLRPKNLDPLAISVYKAEQAAQPSGREKGFHLY